MIIFIVNPLSGNGKANKIYERLEKKKLFTNHSIRTYITQSDHHLSEIIEEIFQLEAFGERIRLLVVIGGDGTIHEFVNFLQHKRIPIAYIPCGSGNDFARGISLRKSPEKIINDALRSEKTSNYWLGRYTTVETEERSFVNCLGFGFDAVVAKRANESGIRNLLKRLRLHKFIYIFALIRELITYKPIKVTLTLDGVSKRYNNILFLTVNNHPYFGGGMKINPQATNNREKFSLILVEMLPKWKILTLFGTVFFGSHIHFKEVHLLSAKHVTIQTSRKIPYQVDGEIAFTNHANISIDQEPILLTGLDDR